MSLLLFSLLTNLKMTSQLKVNQRKRIGTHLCEFYYFWRKLMRNSWTKIEPRQWCVTASFLIFFSPGSSHFSPCSLAVAILLAWTSPKPTLYHNGSHCIDSYKCMESAVLIILMLYSVLCIRLNSAALYLKDHYKCTWRFLYWRYIYFNLL